MKSERTGKWCCKFETCRLQLHLEVVHKPRAHDVMRGYVVAVERAVERDRDVGQPEHVEVLWQASFDAVHGVGGRSVDEVVGDLETDGVVLRRDADRGRRGEGGHAGGRNDKYLNSVITR